MNLQELEQKEAELWKTICDNDKQMQPIKHQWSDIHTQIHKAKLREEVLREMNEAMVPAQPL